MQMPLRREEMSPFRSDALKRKRSCRVHASDDIDYEGERIDIGDSDNERKVTKLNIRVISTNTVQKSYLVSCLDKDAFFKGCPLYIDLTNK